ncbi:MAG TPA: hypothetical protein VGM20_11485 [Gemmatimonadales bacterium]|jgi:tRNA(Leu) C34 or U34 (ribose-2'-O)-methylase TrmL
MPLHIALLEPKTAEVSADLARRCILADASLHLVAPAFTIDDPAFSTGQIDWQALDWWIHPMWRDFRDAMSRERCLYFAADADRDPVDAPFRPNSVLVFGNEALQLPDKIREKYPDRVYGLPRAAKRKERDAAAAIELTLQFVAKRATPAPATPGRSRRRHR